MINASQLYDYSQCSHRVSLDLFGDPLKRDEPNPFVQLLWDHGNIHEAQIVSSMKVCDLSDVDITIREQATLAAMSRGEPLIYRGRITSGDLIGEPDLLELRGKGYLPGDIKSGSGLEETSSGNSKFKEHYAFQLAHYVQILEGISLSDGSREGFIVDRTGLRVPYLLLEPQGIRNTMTWWESYQLALHDVRNLVSGAKSRSALAAECKLCHWYSYCKQECIDNDDLTLIAELGRSKRDAMINTISTVADLATCNPDVFIKGKKTIFPGIGPDSLLKYHERAKLLSTPGAKPFLKQAITLPVAKKEVFFDIEADPMRDIVYLHGFVERPYSQPDGKKFIPFYSDGIDSADEEAAFSAAWKYLAARVLDSTVYYYSSYERTAYKKLAEKYPKVCSIDEVITLFELPAMVDLYTDVVKKYTEWPTYNQSIKTLAQFLEFDWRDTHPSGAASIEWYNRWVETGDPTIKQRILDYNEDDCLATGVVVDGIRAF
jgi:predicted RecB family nuclease